MFNTDHLSVGVIAGSYEVPMDLVTLQSVAVVVGADQHVPVARLVMTDAGGFFQNTVPLTDGLKMQILLGPSNSKAIAYNFRLFRPHTRVAQTGMRMQMDMYFDNPVYFGGTTTQALTGSSSDAIQTIAFSNGLDFEVDPTQDPQVWLPSNNRWCQFARDIAMAGWKSSNSLMQMVLTEQGLLRYKDIGSYTYGGQIPIFRIGTLETDGTYFPVQSWKRTSVSGFHNFRGAYHGAQQAQSYLEPNGIQGTHSTVGVTRSGQFLDMNSSVKDSLQGGLLYEWSEIDCGNTHPNYLQATYQNARLHRTNAQRISLLTISQTKVNVLDEVKVQVFTPSVAGEVPTEYQDVAGNYVVESKTLYGGMEGIYCERFELVRNSHNLLTGQDEGGV